MKTPKIYNDNLKNGIITDEMISDVLYSYSKRAKNYRDKIREYRHIPWFSQGYHYYDNLETMENKRDALYEKKSKILEYFSKNLVCIHKQDKHARRRIYDYEKEYKKVVNNRYDDIVWSNCYFDNGKNREVYFVDVLSDRKEYLYFLYYEFPNHSFHSPIAESDISKYNTEVQEIDDLITYGEEINELLSLQFCDKIYNFIINNFKINEDDEQDTNKQK